MKKARSQAVVGRIFFGGHSGWARVLIIVSVVVTPVTVCFGDGLQQYWPFDEGTGSVVSNGVSGGNAGSLINFGANGSEWDTDVPAALVSRSTGSLNFNYVNDSYINCGHLGLEATQNGGEASVSMWIKPESLSDMRIWGQCSSTTYVPLGYMRFTPGSSGNGCLESGSISASGWYPITSYSVVTGAWNHLVVTWKGAYMTAFLNGNPQYSFLSAFEFDLDGGDQPLAFGVGAKYRGTSGNAYCGKMDEVSVWSEALSIERIHQLAAGVSPMDITPSAGSVAPQFPLAEYRLDNNANDSRGNNDGVIGGDASFVSDTPFTYSDNMALTLDGSGDYVQIADNEILRPGTNDWTLSLWFKASAMQSSALIAKHAGTPLYTQMSLMFAGGTTGSMGTADRIHTFIVGTEGISKRWEITTLGGLADDNWHHVALVRTGDDWRPVVYIDGIIADIAVLNTDSGTRPHDVNCTEPWYIGCWDGSKNYFTGLIDEVAMWNEALTSENIAWLANNSLTSIFPKGTIILMQ